jgi:DNA polymerase-3 subunit delta'
LKTLEEPSQESLILLTTSLLERVLDTVKSRCHIVHFFPLENEKLKETLMKDHKLEREVAHFLAYFSEGALGKAKRIHSEGVIQKKNRLIDQFVYFKGGELELQKVFANEAKETTKEAFDILLSWFRDLMLLKLRIKEMKLIHQDRIQDLKRLEARYSFEELQDIICQIVETSRSLEDNFNIKIALSLLKEAIWRR